MSEKKPARQARRFKRHFPHAPLLAALLSVFLSLGLPALGATSARAQEGNGNAPADNALQLSADTLVYAEKEKRLVASGKARVAWDERSLLADEIVYDLAAGILTASPGAVLTTEDTSTYHADNLTLYDDFSRGSASAILVFLTDDSQLFAEEMDMERQAEDAPSSADPPARKGGDILLRLRNVAYSACRCDMEALKRAEEAGAQTKENYARTSGTQKATRTGLTGEENLSWHIRADKATWNQARRIVVYRGVRLRLFGVPVFYTPYLTLPDPAVRRKSGFLAPRFYANNYLGQSAQARYFYAATPETNLEFTPFYTTNRGLGTGILWEQLLEQGSLTVDLQWTRSEPRTASGLVMKRRSRGYFFGDLESDINDHWRSGASIHYASDKTYLRDYGIAQTRSHLVRRVWVERLGRDTYFRAQGATYQSLRENETSETAGIKQPDVLPWMDWNWRGAPWRGFYPELEIGLRSLRRPGIGNSQRLTISPKVRRSLITPRGHVFSTALAARSTFYGFTEAALRATRPDASTLGKGRESRHSVLSNALTLAVGWRWPLVVRQIGARTHLLEPQVQLVSFPGNPNRNDTPNEESQNLDLDRARLFRVNRYPGLDRSEEGRRLDYGAAWTMRESENREVSVFLGQSARLDSKRTQLPEYSGYSGRRTDWVGNVSADWDRRLLLETALRLDDENFSINSHDTELRLKTEQGHSAQIGYYYGLRRPPPEDLAHREELDLTLGSPLRGDWRGQARFVRDLHRNQVRRMELTFILENDCLHFRFTLYQNRGGSVEKSKTDSGFDLLFDLRSLTSAKLN